MTGFHTESQKLRFSVVRLDIRPMGAMFMARPSRGAFAVGPPGRPRGAFPASIFNDEVTPGTRGAGGPGLPPAQGRGIMARRPRSLHSGTYVHITQQCELQDFLLSDPATRGHYLALLEEVIRKYAFVVLAYCIMENHIHLLAKVGEDTALVSRAMQSLAGRMAQDYNRRTGRRGHFWRDRFASTLIGTARHFRNVISYIDANPLNRRGGVAPIRWRYCSYRELQGGASEFSVVDRAELVRALRMRDIGEFVAWQRTLMERQEGRRTTADARICAAYSGHFALGTYAEMRLLQRRLGRRGRFAYCRCLGTDFEGDPLWALDLCGERYAARWESRHFIGPDPQFGAEDNILQETNRT